MMLPAVGSLRWGSSFLKLVPSIMPKLARGVYEKIGYPRSFHFDGLAFAYKAPGQTRMLYVCEEAAVVAKVLPASSSPNWQTGWDQNEVEAHALAKLSGVWWAPKVRTHSEMMFTNTWGVEDVMDILVISEMGSDMQDNAGKMNLQEYCDSYRAALYAINTMAQLDVVVPDPWPYNMAEYKPGGMRCLPCDFGAAEPFSEHSMKQGLKKLFTGFVWTVKKAYGVDAEKERKAIAFKVGKASAELSPELLTHIGKFFSDVGSKEDSHGADAAGGPPESVPSPPPVPPPFTSAQPHPASIAPGRFVLVQHLKKNPQLNDVTGFVEAPQGDRWVVYLCHGHRVAISAEKLSEIPWPHNAWVCTRCQKAAYFKQNPVGGWSKSRGGNWKCPSCSSGPVGSAAPPCWNIPSDSIPPTAPPASSTSPTAPPTSSTSPTAPPPPAPPPSVAAPVPQWALVEAQSCDALSAVLHLMVEYKMAGYGQEERRKWWSAFVLARHPDKLPVDLTKRTDAAAVTYCKVRGLESDFARRLKQWFVG